MTKFLKQNLTFLAKLENEEILDDKNLELYGISPPKIFQIMVYCFLMPITVSCVKGSDSSTEYTLLNVYLKHPALYNILN